MDANKTKKLSTGISELDSLFYGGIHYEPPTNAENIDNGLLFLARGKHGVNKVHLAMQMCEGLHNSIKKVENELVNRTDWIHFMQEEKGKKITEKSILFISLNKDEKRLRDTYVGFYIQRLINDVQICKILEDEFYECINQLGWTISDDLDDSVRDKMKIEGDKGKACNICNNVKEGIINGSVFYDARTQTLHLKSTNSNSRPPSLYTLNLNDIDNNIDISFIGSNSNEIHHKELKEDTLNCFNNMMVFLLNMRENWDKHGKKGHRFNCLMIDGLSRLTEEDICKCRFSDLTEVMRKVCKVGIITADEKLLPTSIATDMVIDMEIREEHNPDCLQHALKISKCLYQDHVYGWHCYKMRRIGIEVIPSLHFQMNNRFHMDDAAYYAKLKLNQVPYDYFASEYEANQSNEENPCKIWSDFRDNENEKGYEIVGTGELYAINVDRSDDGQYLITKIKGICDKNKDDNGKENHVLFVDLSRNRKEFYDTYYKVIKNEGFFENRVHLFNYRPGHIHDDDFLYSIEKQVQAIVREILRMKEKKENKKIDLSNDAIKKYYKLVHVIIGDINYINFAYPCLNKDNLLLPAISNFTKKYHMTNYVYTSASWEISILEKEKDLYQQLKLVSKMLF